MRLFLTLLSMVGMSWLMWELIGKAIWNLEEEKDDERAA